MNRFVQLFTKLLAVIVVIALSGNNLSAQELIAYWNFNSGANGTPWNSPISASNGSGNITAGNWEWNDLTYTDGFAGSTQNALFGDPAGASLSLKSDEMNGNYIQFEFTMTGFENLKISYWTRKTSTGFSSNQWSWSADGVNFSNVGNPIDPTSQSSGEVINLDAPSQLNGVANAYLRYTLDGATSGSGNNRIDNFQLNASQPGAVSPPVNLSASAASTSQIDLSWQPNTDDDAVLLAWSDDGVFGDPAGVYNIGDPITGGGIVLLFNTNTLFSHEDLDPGTTYYYKAWSYDGSDYSIGITANATTMPLPATTALPYNEIFGDDLGECYVYSVSGPTKLWNHGTYEDNGYAQINGFNSGDLEVDWLILPGINFNDYENELMTFETWWRYGEDDDDNYLKLFYSADYPGTGDPTAYTWTELSFTQPDQEQTWAGSGNINLSALNGNMVYIGFKYRYESGKYKWWQVDNISITGDPVGIANHPGNMTIGIWPNPATGFVTLEAPVSMAHIRIMNIGGAIVKEIPVNAMKTTADVSDLARGYYIVEIQPTSEMAPIRKKLIIH